MFRCCNFHYYSFLADFFLHDTHLKVGKTTGHVRNLNIFTSFDHKFHCGKLSAVQEQKTDIIIRLCKMIVIRFN